MTHPRFELLSCTVRCQGAWLRSIRAPGRMALSMRRLRDSHESIANAPPIRRTLVTRRNPSIRRLARDPVKGTG